MKNTGYTISGMIGHEFRLQNERAVCPIYDFSSRKWYKHHSYMCYENTIKLADDTKNPLPSNVEGHKPLIINSFTLVELLIVIGIIAILATILFPALNSAKEQARRIVCANNLKQIGCVLVEYREYNRGYFPSSSGYSSSAGRFWAGQLNEYLTPKIYPDSYKSAFSCPNRNISEKEYPGHYYNDGYGTYGANRFLTGRSWTTAWWQTNGGNYGWQGYLQTNMVFIVDLYPDRLDWVSPYTLSISSLIIAWRHNIGTNRLWTDTHVDREKFTGQLWPINITGAIH